jgi:hypothetical protein
MKNYGTLRSKHGWGTKKNYLIKYLVDPSLENVISKLNGTFILKVFFLHTYIHTLLRYYFMHGALNLNKFKDS